MKEIKIYETPDIAASALAQYLSDLVNRAAHPFHIALSGGSTPMLLFEKLANDYALNTDWKKVHFWWGDERCVPADHAESNYGNAREFLMDKDGEPLFDQAPVLPDQIHPIQGEIAPEEAANTYSMLIQKHLRTRNKLPVFDLILLGLGDDGHTASIFPDQLSLLKSANLCEVATHPQSGQKRVTLTGKVLNNANKVIFLVTGKPKAKRVAQIINGEEAALSLPAYYIRPTKGTLAFFLDSEAAELIK